MNKTIEIPKTEPCTSDRLRMIAKMNKIEYRPDEADEEIRKRMIEELNRRKDDVRYKNIRGFIKLSLLHCEGCRDGEYEIRL